MKKEEIKKLVRRLHILKGQIDGLEKMVTDETECDKVIVQAKALRNGCSSVIRAILEQKYCQKKDKMPTQKQMKEFLDILIKL